MAERQQRKAEAFRALHEGEPFVIPNPWDAGSARMLEALGFEALATTSSGFAFTLGKRDGDVTLDEVAAHVAALDTASELPVSVDLENGYDASADGAASRSGAWPRRARWAGRSRTGTASSSGSTTSTTRSSAWPPPPTAARDIRLPVHLHRARREPHPRPGRPRRHDRPPAGVRARRRGRALRAGAADPRRDPHRLRRGLEAGQRARRPVAEPGRDGRGRCAAGQRRRRAHLGRRQGGRGRGRARCAAATSRRSTRESRSPTGSASADEGAVSAPWSHTTYI